MGYIFNEIPGARDHKPLQIPGLPEEITRIIESMITRAVMVRTQIEGYRFYVTIVVKANAPYLITEMWYARGMVSIPEQKSEWIVHGIKPEVYDSIPITHQLVDDTRETIQRGMVEAEPGFAKDISSWLGQMPCYRSGAYFADNYVRCLLTLVHILNA